VGLDFFPRPAAPIPILLGATSDRGVARVGRVADGFHGTNLTPPAAAEMIRRIREAASDAGRDPAGLRFTTLCELDVQPEGGVPEDSDIHLVGSPQEIVDRVGRFAAAGIEHIALRVRALSGSTRRGIEPTLSLEVGLDQLHAFAELAAAEFDAHVPSPEG